MTTAYWCVLIAGLLPYFTVAVAKRQGIKSYDNKNPREWIQKQDDLKRRTYAAHLNGFEVFPLFAAGVIVAHLTHATQSTIDILAISFIAIRVVYVWCYMSDRSSLRSLVWFFGLGVTIALFSIGK
jgi:uncharacterized MAPEG superfamily protein